MADRLALVEEANEALAENIAAEVNRKLLVQVDIVAVFLQTLDTSDVRFFGGKSLGSVGSIGGPGEHGKLDCLGNLGEQETVRSSHGGALSCGCKEADCSKQHSARGKES